MRLQGPLLAVLFLAFSAGSAIAFGFLDGAAPGPGARRSATSFASSGTPADTEDPTDPTSLAAVTVSAGGIDLTWTASTDNVGVDHYNIERCTGAGCSSFSQIDTAPSNSYSNTGLAASTSYTYRVIAEDAAGNTSGPSNEDTDVTDAPRLLHGHLHVFCGLRGDPREFLL